MVEFPLSLACLLFLFDLKEEDVTRTPGNQGRVVDKIHLSEVHFGHSVESIILDILGINDEGLALSIEAVDLIPLLIVEALVWEVLLCASEDHRHHIALNLFGL